MRKCEMTAEIYDLRSALEFMEKNGESVVVHDSPIKAKYEIAQHYVKESAGVPASTVSRDEKVIRYERVEGHDIPVLIGMFGARSRNQLLLTGQPDSHHFPFMQALQERIKPIKIDTPKCQQVVIDKDINLTRDLPILTLSEEDSGPYIGLGFVFASDPETGDYSASVHRLCVQGKDELSISIYPGRQLGLLYEAALSKGKTLSVSINIGLDPAIYYASCLTEPLRKKGECKLDVVGGLRGKAVNLSACLKVEAECLSDAEIVIEGEITSQQIAENQSDASKGSMPEFTGYQGAIAPGVTVPVIKVKAITHRKNPIYQTVIGPGLEQSELQAITPEIATRFFLKQNFDLDIKDVVYTTSGGGLFMSIIQLEKHSEKDDVAVIEAGLKVLSLAPPFKHLFLVGEDVDPHSSDDVLWALTTRFQADCDLHTANNPTPFMMDLSQTPEYRSQTDNNEESCRALFDCTVPWRMKEKFKRPFVNKAYK